MGLIGLKGWDSLLVGLTVDGTHRSEGMGLTVDWTHRSQGTYRSGGNHCLKGLTGLKG